MKQERKSSIRSGNHSRVVMTGLVVGLTIICATLGGCSIPIADLPGIGLPANAPARSDNPPAYLPVHDVPPPRDDAVLTTDEQKKIQADLLNARDKQTAEANALVKSTNGTPASSGK